MAVKRGPISRPHCKACLLRKINRHVKYDTTGELTYARTRAMSRCIVCGYMADYKLSIVFNSNEDLLSLDDDLLSIDPPF